MDNGIILIAALVASIVTAAVAWLALRRNLPPDAALALATYVAAIRAQLSGVVDEDMVRTLAGAVWDRWGDGARYFARDQFIEYVLRALRMEPEAQYVIASSTVPGFVARSGSLRLLNQTPE